MGKLKKKQSNKFAAMKRMINLSDQRLKEKDRAQRLKKTVKESDAVREVAQYSSALYFRYNEQLGPPYRILMDTNFINFSVLHKLDIIQAMMDCLYAKCVPYITDCVMGELERLGTKYRVALRIAKDPRFERLTCSHKGIYADDCLVQRVTEHKCFIVGTCDKDLKRRIRKIPGVPIMYIVDKRYTIERMPEAYGAPKNK
ncbi:rRNA-processing protein FCF1 homolog [Galendromus occidentalis]|uniref:rRNA-processing protein FCF1 homolog n=1 Tax=Galendromus occidentalis TaxID=34638 RepID=A0AAJ6QLJ4_9ACAR|nr:rRNA-processing protein FCF1 homolog [Galendromus occidentalis]